MHGILATSLVSFDGVGIFPAIPVKMDFPLEAWYMEIPPVTRAFITLSAIVTLGTQLRMLSWFQLYYSHELVFKRGEWWRLLTTFLYFGQFSLDWFFHMYFTVRYSRMLEEGSFRNRTADYAWFILYTCVFLIVLSPIMSSPFLGTTFAYVLAYLWSRREPWVRLNFLGLFVFRAPYLPWVLLGFTFIMTGHLPIAHLLGIAVGHVYHFYEDVWPRHGGKRWLRAPRWFQMLFPVDAAHVELMEEEDEGIEVEEAPRLGGVAPVLLEEEEEEDDEEGLRRRHPPRHANEHDD